MNENLKNIVRLYEYSRITYGTGNVNVDLNDRLSDLMSAMYSPGPSFHALFNFETFAFDYVSAGAAVLFGEDHVKIQPEEYLGRVHPDDTKHYISMEELVNHFIYHIIPRDEMLNYKISFQYRVKVKSGEYRNFLHQVVALAIDEEGRLSKTFANLSDIEHITKFNNRKLTLFGLNGRPDYYNISSKDDFEIRCNDQKQFTQREIEILQLLAEGHTSSELASMLNISIDTVRTHRQNIVAKSPRSNITSIIAHSIRQGVI